MPITPGPGGIIQLPVSAQGVNYALTLAPTRVRVHFGYPPRKRGGTMDGDAQDPSRWSIVPENFTPEAGDPGWPVVAVLEEDVPDANTIMLATIRELHPTFPLGVDTVLSKFHVTGTGVRSDNGIVFFSQDAIVNGMTTLPPSKSPAPAMFGTDLANPMALAGLQIGLDGDLETEEGLPLLKKLIIRRVITPRGRFLHAPGIGALPGIKGLIRRTDLPELQAQLQNEVLAQAGIAASRVTVEQNGGIVTVTVKARTEGGIESTLTVPLTVT